jgi:hypothetical protein
MEELSSSVVVYLCKCLRDRRSSRNIIVVYATYSEGVEDALLRPDEEIWDEMWFLKQHHLQEPNRPHLVHARLRHACYHLTIPNSQGVKSLNTDTTQ